MSKEVYIMSAVRTPIGSYGGSLKSVPAHELAALVIREAISSAGVTYEEIDEVVMGEVRNSEVSNVARVASLYAGLQVDIPAYTVNRLCASAMQALWCGYQAIRNDDADIMVAGGVENMSRGPVYISGDRFGKEPLSLTISSRGGGGNTVPHNIYGHNLTMIQTAQNVADKYSISRKDQDLFALESQKRCARALSQNRFKDEIVPVELFEGKKFRLFDTDEFNRSDSTLEALRRLKPVIPGGTVTAGNSCGLNDGASAVILMSEDKVKKLNVKPMGRIVGLAATGVDPKIMGIGPISAVRKVLKKTNMSLKDIDLIELNEAFASQSLAVIKELGFDTQKTNVNGGAIALGHPLGATGVRLIVTLLHEMRKQKIKFGLATLCVGGGQGMAVIVENILD